MQLTRDLVRIFAVQKQLQRVRLAADILLVEQLREPRLLRLERRFVSREAAAQPGEPLFHVPRLLRQFVQSAVGFRYRALRFAQCIDRLAFRFLGVGEPFLQRVDAAAQLAQVLPCARGVGAAAAVVPAPRSRISSAERSGRLDQKLISGLPVISGGCGRPIILSSVGATSCSAPRSATRALRPT